MKVSTVEYLTGSDGVAVFTQELWVQVTVTVVVVVLRTPEALFSVPFPDCGPLVIDEELTLVAVLGPILDVAPETLNDFISVLVVKLWLTALQGTVAG